MRREFFQQTITTQTNRRQFLKLISGAGAGLTLALHMPSVAMANDDATISVGQAFTPNAFVRIGTDNTVTVMVKHVEMGQGTYTGLLTLVADELDADWQQVVPQGAPADASRYNNLSWGPMQGTGGSSAMPNSFMQLRTAGATAKAMLVAAAAKKWGVSSSEIKVNKGVVMQGANKATFGELAEAAAKLPVPAESSITLKTPEQFVYIGTQVSRKDIGKNNGTAIFTQDIQLPGMLTALVLHPPKFGATLISVNDTEAKASPGVVDVVTIPSGVAVLAKDYWSAKKGRDILQAKWDDTKAYTGSSEQMMADYRELAMKTGLTARQDGDPTGALNQAATVLDATYEFPYLAHAAMEPMNCVAKVTKDGCEVWNGEQFQTIDQMNIAATLGIKPEQVKIHMLLAGGSFGRRANPKSDYVLEAVNIAKAKPGIPVKLVWSREDDMQAGYYRPAYVHHLRAGLDEDGNIIAWHQHIVGQSITSGTAFGGMITDGIDGTAVEGASNLPYSIPNLAVQLTSPSQGAPVLWWRSVGSTHTAFAVETMLDELAAKSGQDPVDLRMKLLVNHPRWQGVLKLAADQAGWGQTLPEGEGMGIAVHEAFNTYVAQVAHVAVTNGQYQVKKVVCAVDCGLPINPDVIKAQMEGGIGFGLSAVMVSAITLKKGKVEQSNFHNFQVLRINQMPEIDVHIVPSTEPPTGVGEPGVPPIAPAVANALAAASGKRYYSLPIKQA